FRVLNDPSTVRSDWPIRSPDVRSRTCQCSANGYVSATSRMRCSNRFKFCVICSTQGYVVLRRRELPINIANFAWYERYASLNHATCCCWMVQSHNHAESWNIVPALTGTDAPSASTVGLDTNKASPVRLLRGPARLCNVSRILVL